MPWVVVEFLPHRGFEENTVQTVPLCWLVREGNCQFILYPPVGCPHAVVQKMIRREQQPAESWDLLLCTYVTSPFDDLLSATQLEIKVADCEESDLETFVATLSSGGEKRKRVAKNIRYPNEPLSDSEYVDNEDIISNPPSPPDNVLSRANVGASCKTVLATQPPKPLQRPGEARTFGLTMTEKQKSSYSCAFSAASKIENKNSKLPITTRVGAKVPRAPHKVSVVELNKPSTSKRPSVKPISFSGTSRERAQEASQVDLQELFSGPSDSINMVDEVASGSTNCPTTELKAFITKVMDDFKKEVKNDLRRELRGQIALSTEEVKEAINAISFKMDAMKFPTNGDVEEGELIHVLPMETIEDMAVFENEICSNSKYRKFMVQYLRERSSNMLFRNLTAKLYQTAINKTVNDVLSLLFSNELGMQFCMKGRNQKKISFESNFPSIMNLVFEVLKTKGNPGPQIELLTVGRSMGEWFRLARMRAGVPKVDVDNGAANVSE